MASQLHNILRGMPASPSSAPPDLRMKFALFILEQLAEDIHIRIHFKDKSAPITVGNEAGKEFILFVNQPETLWEMLRNPDPGLGEAYVAGHWSLYSGDLGELLTALANGYQSMMRGLQGKLFARLFAGERIKRPYDITTRHKIARLVLRGGEAFFAKMLGPGLADGFGLFEDGEEDLAAAQSARHTQLLAAMRVAPRMRVLDIACGWGGRAKAIADHTLAGQINALTNHERQHAFAKDRVPDLYNSPLNYYIQDYREHAENHGGYYDRILSHHMLEKAGPDHWDRFMRTMRHMLHERGELHLSVLVRPEGKAASTLQSPWMDQNIAPGASAVSLAVLEDLAQEYRLRITEEPLLDEPYHGGITAMLWRKNIYAHKDAIAEILPAEKIRIWEFYLASLQAMFDSIGVTTGHVVLKRA